MNKSKLIALRLNELEEKIISESLGGKKISSTLIKEVLLNKQYVIQGISKEWLELIKILEDDFLDLLSVKSGSKENVTKWAVYLLSLLRGNEIQSKDAMVYPYSNYKLLPNRHGEKNYDLDEEGKNKYINIESPVGKREQIGEKDSWFKEVCIQFNVIL